MYFMFSCPLAASCQTVDFAVMKFGAKTEFRYLCVCFQDLCVTHTQIVGQDHGYFKYSATQTSHPMPPRHLREQEHQHFLSSRVVRIFFFSRTQWGMTFTSLTPSIKKNHCIGIRLTNVSLCHCPPQQTVLSDEALCISNSYTKHLMYIGLFQAFDISVFAIIK